MLLGLFSGFGGKPRAAAKYGEKVRFSPGAPIKLEDFDLTYGGESRVAADEFPRGFLYHDFNIETADEERTVSWSSGTGDVAPTAFEIGGKKYDLELAMSDKLGKPAAAAPVVWKK